MCLYAELIAKTMNHIHLDTDSVVAVESKVRLQKLSQQFQQNMWCSNLCRGSLWHSQKLRP